LAIKESYSAVAYSQRTFCHSILVPAAVEYGFTLRTTGREPLNNQPFFRYDNMELIDRVSGGSFVSLNELRDALHDLKRLGPDEALAGLAAFLRVRVEAANALRYELPEVDVPLDQLIRVIEEYLEESVDRPRRTQALVCAAFDLIFDQILTRRI